MEVITSRKNQHVCNMRNWIKSVDFRKETGMFAVEGDHLCGELADCLNEIQYFLYTEKAGKKYPETVKKAVGKSFFSAVITDELSEYISDTKSPQGLFAAAGDIRINAPENARRAVVLDGVQDPGNVGTIIRAAEAFGADFVLMYNSAEAHNPKTLRASMGSVFRMSVGLVNCAEDLKKRLNGFQICGAMLDDTAKRLGEVEFPEKTAIVIGSEGRGISPEIAEICDEKIYIPIKGAESLNAAMAASVLLWELSK